MKVKSSVKYSIVSVLLVALSATAFFMRDPILPYLQPVHNNWRSFIGIITLSTLCLALVFIVLGLQSCSASGKKTDLRNQLREATEVIEKVRHDLYHEVKENALLQANSQNNVQQEELNKLSEINRQNVIKIRDLEALKLELIDNQTFVQHSTIKDLQERIASLFKENLQLIKKISDLDQQIEIGSDKSNDSKSSSENILRNSRNLNKIQEMQSDFAIEFDNLKKIAKKRLSEIKVLKDLDSDLGLQKKSPEHSVIIPQKQSVKLNRNRTISMARELVPTMERCISKTIQGCSRKIEEIPESERTMAVELVKDYTVESTRMAQNYVLQLKNQLKNQAIEGILENTTEVSRMEKIQELTNLDLPDLIKQLVVINIECGKTIGEQYEEINDLRNKAADLEMYAEEMIKRRRELEEQTEKFEIMYGAFDNTLLTSKFQSEIETLKDRLYHANEELRNKEKSVKDTRDSLIDLRTKFAKVEDERQEMEKELATIDLIKFENFKLKESVNSIIKERLEERASFEKTYEEDEKFIRDLDFKHFEEISNLKAEILKITNIMESIKVNQPESEENTSGSVSPTIFTLGDNQGYVSSVENEKESSEYAKCEL